MLQIAKPQRQSPALAPALDEAAPGGASPTLINSYIRLFRQQLPIIIFSLLLAAVLAAVYLVTTPPSFTAEARLIIDARKGQLFQQSFLAESPVDAMTVESQVEILKSENIALKVIKDLYLANDREFTGYGGGPIGAVIGFFAKLVDGNEPPSEFELTRRALKTFQNRVNVKRVGLTYVIEITFRSVDAERAATIANAVAEAYIVDQLDAKYQAARRASGWLQERIGELREQASVAERSVVDFKTKHNIVDAGGKLISDQQLGELNTQLVLARAQVSETRAKLARIEQVVNSDVPDGTVTDSLKNDVVTKLRSSYLELRAREADWSARYGHDHLAAVDLRNRMREIRKNLVDELRRLAETYKSEFEISKQREESAQKELDQAVSRSQITNQAQVTLRALESSAQSYRTLYDNFLQRYMESVQQQSFPITEARLISRATKPLNKSHPQTALVLAIAGFAGLAFGFGGAMVREMNDRTFRTTEQVESVLQANCIALTPRMPHPAGAATASSSRALSSHREISRSERTDLSVIRSAVSEPFSRFAEELRSIKLAIDLNDAVQGNKIIAFTSALPGEGKTTLAGAVAHLIAATGGRVLLVDCDLRNPSLTKTLAPGAQAGIVEVLRGDATVQQLAIRDEATGLEFLPAVVNSPLMHSNEILSSDAAKKLFDRLREVYEYVVVDLSPIAPVVDVRATSQLVDMYIFVVEWGRTHIEIAEKALRSAPGVYQNLLGVVLNKADIKRLNRYERYGGSYYNNKSYRRYGYSD